MNKNLTSGPKSKQELVRKGVDIDKDDDFDEDNIVDTKQTGGKIDKVIVSKKVPLNAPDNHAQKNMKKKVKKD